ncbi:MAG: hypothetical protein Q9212_007500 [Teloschistes hypoglaucus]
MPATWETFATINNFFKALTLVAFFATVLGMVMFFVLGQITAGVPVQLQRRGLHEVVLFQMGLPPAAADLREEEDEDGFDEDVAGHEE